MDGKGRAQVPLAARLPLPAAGQLAAAEPAPRQPQPQQGQELQQGAEAGTQLQERQGEVSIQE